MSPAILEGSYVLICGWCGILPLKAGQIIKVRHIHYGDIIKNLDHIDAQGFLWLRGENGSSVSMLDMGPINKQQVIGIIWFTIQATAK